MPAQRAIVINPPRSRRSYRRRAAMRHIRHRAPVNVGLGTMLGATVAGAEVMAHQYDIPYEVGAAFRGEQSAGAVMLKVRDNIVGGAPNIVLGIALPYIAKAVLGRHNPTLYKGKKFAVRGV